MNKLFFFSIICLLTVSEISAQPSSVLMVTGGYSIAMGDMKGKFGDTWQTYQNNPDSNTYFLRDGYNFGLEMKVAPYRDKKFRILGFIHFNTFTQKAEYADTGISVQINYAMRIFSVAAGAEYAFITKTSKVNPFINAGLVLNLFSGNYDETYSNTTTKNLTLEFTARLGLTFGGGIDIPLGRRLGAVVGFNYNMANLIGKQSTADFGSQYTLNDKEGVVNNEKFSNRSINYMNIYAGFSLYLGI